MERIDQRTPLGDRATLPCSDAGQGEGHDLCANSQDRDGAAKISWRARTKTLFYHSQLDKPWDREQLLKRFVGDSRPEVDRIICTSAFGMGLDVPNVRLVIHWQHPSSIEDYLQEFGRDGRDGKPSVAVLLYDRNKAQRDISFLKFVADRAVEAAQLPTATAKAVSSHKTAQIDRMAFLTTSSGCFRDSLVSYFS